MARRWAGLLMGPGRVGELGGNENTTAGHKKHAETKGTEPPR